MRRTIDGAREPEDTTMLTDDLLTMLDRPDIKAIIEDVLPRAYDCHCARQTRTDAARRIMAFLGLDIFNCPGAQTEIVNEILRRAMGPEAWADRARRRAESDAKGKAIAEARAWARPLIAMEARIAQERARARRAHQLWVRGLVEEEERIVARWHEKQVAARVERLKTTPWRQLDPIEQATIKVIAKYARGRGAGITTHNYQMTEILGLIRAEGFRRIPQPDLLREVVVRYFADLVTRTKYRRPGVSDSNLREELQRGVHQRVSGIVERAFRSVPYFRSRSRTASERVIVRFGAPAIAVSELDVVDGATRSGKVYDSHREIRYEITIPYSWLRRTLARGAVYSDSDGNLRLILGLSEDGKQIVVASQPSGRRLALVAETLRRGPTRSELLASDDDDFLDPPTADEPASRVPKRKRRRTTRYAEILKMN